jgi:N-sulfoglucosamine sulfohydrolase
MKFLSWTSIIFLSMVLSCSVKQDQGGRQGGKDSVPNILICIADDASHPHMGTDCKWVNTPAFDRVAREGIMFINAYTPNAKCAPSRACLLTGRYSWQLKEAANHFNNFPAEFKTYPEVLEENGYYVGFTAKGWGPGNPGMKDGKRRELTGEAWNSRRLDPPTTGIANIDYAANFEEFYNSNAEGKPFCFWYGGIEPHRRYEFASSLRAGKKTGDIDTVPPFFPDTEDVRTDLLDYGLEIEYFDLHVQRMLEFLEEKGELENTLVVVTSDQGMPFPRAKSDAYDYSTHVPLAIMWKNGLKKPGRIIEDYVSFVDLAPTFLDLAGIRWEESGMQATAGKSLAPVFMKTIRKEPFRDHLLVGKERHDVGRPHDYGYPIRGIIKDNWLYLVNYRNDLWPAGNPETGYSTVGGSPTKTAVIQSRHNPETKYLWDLSFGKRKKEELYHLESDPYCVNNLAEDHVNDAIKAALSQRMETELKNQNDPRMFGEGNIFHTYEFTAERWRNYYERRVINKEDVVPSWINASDIETDFLEESDNNTK